MPLFMDVHPGIGDATPEDIAAAHARDLEVQEKYGVRFLTYFYSDPSGKTFCLVDAPDAESAKACHKEAHGLMPHDIIEVDDTADGILIGDYDTNEVDRAMLPGLGGAPDTGLRVIMFTDVEGSTDLSTSLGDDVALGVVRAHDQIVRECLREFGGREVKHTGDGMLACFNSATAAIDAALAVQERAAGNELLAIKIGMSAGEPVEDSRDLYGAAVNLAARICAHVPGGQTFVAGTIRDLLIGKPVQFRDEGQVALKGFADPVPVFALTGRS